MFTYEFPKADNTASVIAYCATQNFAGKITSITLLLIRRGKDPDKGLLALPGGFLNCTQETLEECASRELREETGIDKPHGNFKLERVSSRPDRDPRGHVIDHVYSVWVNQDEMEKAKAGDDAAGIEILRFDKDSSFNGNEMAFDHVFALHEFFGNYGMSIPLEY